MGGCIHMRACMGIKGEQGFRKPILRNSIGRGKGRRLRPGKHGHVRPDRMGQIKNMH
ncbi:hypothetical protein SDC9_209558 [bioreactor metagenome]|uniref:Uncharacterized protein n=1 Tax=bioreactor metagenome TaxID=1076179 RepID=A0A645JNA6_9ZZZZ